MQQYKQPCHCNQQEYGCAEAASDLQYMAGIEGPIVMCEIDSRSTVPGVPEVDAVLIEKEARGFVRLAVKARLPTKYGDFEIYR